MKTQVKRKLRKYMPGIVILLAIIVLTKLSMSVSFGSDETTARVESNLQKYINYDLSEQDKGTLVQYQIKTGIEYGENQEHSLIKKSETTLAFGEIDGKYPKAVKILLRDNDYQYDANNGILTIAENNANESHEYTVIGYYDTYVEENITRKLNLKTSTKITLEADEVTVTKDNSFETEVNEKIGELTSTHRATEDIYNGYMKSNQINGTNYTTQYKEMNQITVSKKEAQETLEIIEENNLVRQKEEIEELGNKTYLVYKSTRIAKEDIKNLLGEEGTLEILDKEGNLIAVINQETEFGEDGTITVSYENDLTSLIIKTSNIQKEGILRLEQTKEIRNNLPDINNMKIKTITKIGENTKEDIIEIKDATTEVNLEINHNNWTNQQQNEVNFNISLDANSIRNNMFKNPSIQIELPSQVEKVILGSSSIVYANGLSLKDPYIETTEDGKIRIIANLEGQQTTYDENALGLTTNIQITATVILKKDIEDAKEKVNIIYSNEYTIDGNPEIGVREVDVQLESYQEEKKILQEESTVTYKSAQKTKEVANQVNVDAIKLEVAPVKGDVNIANEDIVYEGEFIKYNIKVTNTSDTVMENVKVIGNIPEGTTYGELEAEYYTRLGKYQYNFDETIKEKQIEIGTLKPGESITKFYEVKINNLEEGIEEKQIQSNIKAYVAEQEVANYEITNVVKIAQVQVFLQAELDNIKDKWNYIVITQGKQGEKVNLKVKLPEEYTPSSYVTLGKAEYNEETGEYEYDNGDKFFLTEEQIQDEHTVILKNIAVGEAYSIQGTMDSSDIVKDTEASKAELTAVAIVSTNEKSYQSNENRIEFSFPNASITMTSSNEGEEIKYGEEIDYEIVIKNTGRTNIDDEVYNIVSLELKDYLPEEVNPISITYRKQIYDGNVIVSEEEVTEDISGIQKNAETGEKVPNIDLSFTIPYQESRVIKVKAKAGSVFQKTQIENFATIKSIAEEQKIPLKTSNTIKHIILPYNYMEEPNDPNNPENPDIPKDPENPDVPSTKYSISGVAWLDENEDGQRQENEKLLAGIPVDIVEAKEGKIIGNTLTSDNGSYKFQALDKNDYIILFKYDNKAYTVTEYRKNGVSTYHNSDAMDKNILLEGKQITVGVTDVITVNATINNIDIGLIQNKIKDLKLDKYISKATIKTNKRNQQIDYHQAKLGKIEIKAKEIEGAMLTVEYKMIVTNVGEDATTVGNVIDYLPNGFDFSVQNNKSWNINSNTEVVNSSLSNKRLQPGESTDIILVLTKKLNGNTTGTFKNKAEIKGNADDNSSNNFSEADIIISIGTGIFTYICITFGILIIIAIGIVLIHKFGFAKIGKISLFLLMFMTVLITQTSHVRAEPPHSTTSFQCDHPKGQGPNFLGGPGNQGGTCVEHGVWSYSGTFHYSYSSVINTSQSSHDDDVSFSLQKKNETIGIKQVNSNYIFGPFDVECKIGENNYDTGYSFNIYDNQGNVIRRLFNL